ncbi:MAG: DNA replication/repair protein RecF [Alphaproteobacteria bacterium]|nr:DNA replication/repair protein RecF [Alphaproteobacteria bacterium]
MAAAAAVAVVRLDLSDFRCYREARLDIDPRPVVLAGPNGAGKTNLLEAVSFLAPGRGLRRARLSEVDRIGGGPWGLHATVATLAGAVEIGTGRDAEGEMRERRLVRIDGATPRSQTALAGVAGVVWLTPQMDRLFLEGGTARRRFLDRLVYGFDPEHATRVAAYEHALRERGRLLRERPADAAWLGAVEEQMAGQGIAIVAARRELAAAIDHAVAEGVGPFPRPRLGLAGTVEGWLDAMPALAAEERLRAALAAGRRADAETGGAGVGPHRSDLWVRHAAKDMPAEHCSTGEQKALLLAIVLADVRLQAAARGVPPILLLDEVAAHLDEERRTHLYDEILALGVQAWLTGTDAALFAPLAGAAQHFRVADAVVTPR